MTRNERKNTHARIRESMRRNEREVLAHLRTHNVYSAILFGSSWSKALCRLIDAGKVIYGRNARFPGYGYYKPVKYARAVTR